MKAVDRHPGSHCQIFRMWSATSRTAGHLDDDEEAPEERRMGFIADLVLGAQRSREAVAQYIPFRWPANDSRLKCVNKNLLSGSPYLRNPATREKSVRLSAASSSAVEGIRRPFSAAQGAFNTSTGKKPQSPR